MIRHGTSVKVLAAPATVTANGNGTAVDVSKYESLVLLHAVAAVTAGNNTIKLQHSDDGSTGWTDVANAAFPALDATTKEATLLFNSDRFKKFVRVVDTVSGTTPSGVRSVVLVGVTKESQ